MDSRFKRAGMTIERKRVRFGSLQKAANCVKAKNSPNDMMGVTGFPQI